MTSLTPMCPLCHSNATFFHQDRFRDYFQCQRCRSIFVRKDDRPEASEEKSRYETHNNDVNDPGYQRFVSPIVNCIKNHYSPVDEGLDYGAGPGPVITKMLRDEGFDIVTYDPFYDPNQTVFDREYDYIVCSEVMEHFHEPKKEFQRLYQLLKSNGRLVCMTDLFDESIDFAKWYYKNDNTHVFFYHPHALAFIKEAFGFQSLEVEDRLIVFQK